MYFSTLQIMICAKNADRIAEALKDVPAPEDCGFVLKTSESLKTEDIPQKDCAAVTDDPAALAECVKRGIYAVLLTESGDLGAIGAEKLSSADELWVMPEGGLYGESLLRQYFSRTLKNMKEKSDARRLKICFDTAIDSIPDLTWFKDAVGAHLIVNDSFCKAVEKTKRQIYKRGHYYIWDIPKEEYDQGEYVCLESEDVVMEARKTCLFDEKVKTKSGMRRFKTYKSPLIDTDGEIFGTCGIAHDVTDLHNIGNELNLMIESIPFGVVIEDRGGNILTINKFITKYFPNITDHMGKSFEEWKNGVLVNRKRSLSNEEEFFMTVGGKEYVIRFRREPITDIFGERIGVLDFFRDITMQYNFEQKTLKNANTDFLTGLNNRRSLFDHLGGLEKGVPLSIITLDLDNFKSVNDRYGHHAGDEALEATARTLRECFPNDFTARLGGDEFLVAIEGECSSEKLGESAEALLGALQNVFSQREEFGALTASAGLAQAKFGGEGISDVDELMRRSDKALYRAKQTGKAKYCSYID